MWVDGDDVSTVYINDWLNPKGKSYVDIAIHTRGIRASKLLNVYVPFPVSKEEIEDVSLCFNDTKILQAIFSAACIVDYMKNPHTSEIAYNGKTVDIVHLSTLNYQLSALSDGTLMVNGRLRPAGGQDEAIFHTRWGRSFVPPFMPSQWLPAWPCAFRLENLRWCDDWAFFDEGLQHIEGKIN